MHMSPGADDEARRRLDMEFQFIPVVFSEVVVRLCAVPPLDRWKSMSLWSSRCAQGRCHTGTGLVHGKGQHMSVMVSSAYVRPHNA